MRTFMHRVSLGVALLGLSAASQAAEWVLEPGSDIDPMRPTSCKFDVTINIEDIEVDSPEVLDYLLDYELFDVDTWPTATFSAKSCRLTGVNTFESDGTLTIRDQTNPMTFPFELNIETCDGQVCFQGYWANTAEVPNEVKIKVDVYALMQ